MWYKNVRIYQITKDLEISESEVQDKLQQFQFKPCSKHQAESIGWVSPLTDANNLNDESLSALYECHQKCLIFKLRIQDKLLPSSVIKEAVMVKIAQRENQEGRKVFLKEQRQIKDEVIGELLPLAFHRSSYIQGYWNLEKNWLVIDANSSSKAEKFLHVLRNSFTSLPVVPLDFSQSLAAQMTNLLQTGVENSVWKLADECELKSTDEESSLVKFKNQNLYAEEISGHINAGKQVISLRLNWRDAITTTIHEDGALKRLKFSDKIKELDASYSKDEMLLRKSHEYEVMIIELNALIDHYIELMGDISEKQ